MAARVRASDNGGMRKLTMAVLVTVTAMACGSEGASIRDPNENRSADDGSGDGGDGGEEDPVVGGDAGGHGRGDGATDAPDAGALEDSSTPEDDDGGVVGDGDGDAAPQDDAGAPLANRLSANDDTTCALRRGVLSCWGEDDDITDPNKMPHWLGSEVAVGYDHACMIAASTGTIHCWGDDSFGQTSLEAEGSFTSLSAGYMFACAIDTTGTISCWGRNDENQKAAPAGVFTELSCGTAHCCATKNDGSMRCWGRESGTDPGPYHHLRSYQNATCGFSGSSLACFGSNSLLGGAPSVSLVSFGMGLNRICAIESDGAPNCWGSPGEALTPPQTLFTSVVGGTSHFCGFTKLGTIECWGQNNNGQLNVPE